MLLQLQPTKRLTCHDFSTWLETLPVPYRHLSARGRRAAAELFGEMVRGQSGSAAGTSAITVQGTAVESALVRR